MKRWSSWVGPHRRRLGPVRLVPALGVLAMVILALCANVLVARFHTRWDFTTRRLYTLSETTLATLGRLLEPVQVLVLVSRNDPLEPTLRQLLASYTAASSRIGVRRVDPDRNGAEFLAIQQQYGITAGKTEDGRLVADTSLIVVQGERHWFITSDQLVLFDDTGEQARSNVEQALTEGLLNVQLPGRASVCFSKGHEEASLEDGGPHGISELKYQLEKGNFVIRSLNLEEPHADVASCALLVVAGPKQGFSERAAERMIHYLEEQGNLLLLVSPLFDEDERPRATGLEPVVARIGIDWGHNLVLERDPAQRAPVGAGETFQASLEPHDITRAMTKLEMRVLVTSVQSLVSTKDSVAVPLLRSSSQAGALTDLRPLLEGGPLPLKDADQPWTLAIAAELPNRGAPPRRHGPRLVAAGTASIANNESWRETSLRGSRLFLENALSWLLARPAIVSVPPKPTQPIGVGLTEQSLSEVFRYVLVYLPATSLGLGFLVIQRRRNRERRSRRTAPKGVRT